MTEERDRQPEEPTEGKAIRVELTPEEMEHAAAVGAQRHAMGAKLRERYATPDEDTCERLIKDIWEELTGPARTMPDKCGKSPTYARTRRLQWA